VTGLKSINTIQRWFDAIIVNGRTTVDNIVPAARAAMFRSSA
jgi:hypothetical protein